MQNKFFLIKELSVFVFLNRTYETLTLFFKEQALMKTHDFLVEDNYNSELCLNI